MKFFRKYLGKLNEMFSEDIGVDLGTANTLICTKHSGIIISEPSVVAINTRTDAIFGIGMKAKEMIGKTPQHITAIKPLKDGVIADYEITERMLQNFLNKVKKKNFFTSQRVIICVPAGVTHVEKRAVQEVAREAGAREAFLIEEPMAAAIGSNLDIFVPEGHLIVDIGGGTTEVAVISLGGIVITSSLRLAGNKIDEAIIEFVKRNYNIHIGEKTAEDIKIKIGNVFENIEEEETIYEINGRNVISGLPCDIEIKSNEIRDVISTIFDQIVEEIRIILEKTPPELAADINKKGIIVAGGGALIKNLSLKLDHDLGLPVTIAHDPINAVIRGIETILNNYDLYKDILVSEIHQYS